MMCFLHRTDSLETSDLRSGRPAVFQSCQSFNVDSLPSIWPTSSVGQSVVLITPRSSVRSRHWALLFVLGQEKQFKFSMLLPLKKFFNGSQKPIESHAGNENKVQISDKRLEAQRVAKIPSEILPNVYLGSSFHSKQVLNFLEFISLICSD